MKPKLSIQIYAYYHLKFAKAIKQVDILTSFKIQIKKINIKYN
jgi:hypothetical protein